MKGVPTLEMIAEFCHAFRDGMTATEITKKTGLPPEHIRIMQKAGYLWRNGKAYRYSDAMAESHLMGVANVYEKLREVGKNG